MSAFPPRAIGALLLCVTAGAAAATAGTACQYPYDARTGLRLRFESDVPWGTADTLRVWFTTEDDVLLGEMEQDLDLLAASKSGMLTDWGFTVDAYAGDAEPGPVLVRSEARAGETVLADATVAALLVRGAIRDVVVSLVQTVPPPPTLQAAATLTNAATVDVSGTAALGTRVRVAGGASLIEAEVDGAGDWTAVLPLRPNQPNVLVARAVGTGGEESAPSASVTVVHDDVAPDAPLLMALPAVTGSDSVTLTGTSEPGAVIDVAGGAAPAAGTVDAAGTFMVAVSLVPDAVNVLAVTATDGAQNTSASTDATIEHRTGALSVDPVPSHVNFTPLAISGVAPTLGATIEITGGSVTATGTADAATGAFSIPVALVTNSFNALDVHELGSMASVLVFVTHDDAPPAPPVFDPAATPTAATAVMVTGTAEPGATVEIERTAPAGAVVAAVADASGAFAAVVDLSINDTNLFVAVQTDLAGNVSADSAPLTIDQQTTLPAPPSVAPIPSPTSLAMVAVSGTVSNPGTGVDAVVRRGGVEIGSGPASAATGDFSVVVTLLPNAPNFLEVFSRDGVLDSSATGVTVVHDDVPPAAPNGALITAEVGLCLTDTTASVSGASGAVEAGATVVVVGPTGATAMTTASAMGSFTVIVAVGALPCGDNVDVTAIDAAGNSSPTISEAIQ